MAGPAGIVDQCEELGVAQITDMERQSIAKLLVASRAGPARIRYLLTNRILIAVFDRSQQLAGFDDEMLLAVEKAIDVAPGGWRRAALARQLRQLASRREDGRNRFGKCDELYCRVECGCLLAVAFGEIPDLGQRSAHCPHCRMQNRYDALGVDRAGADHARGENKDEGRPGRPTHPLGFLRYEVGFQDVITGGDYRRVLGVIPCRRDWNKFDSRPVFQCYPPFT